MTLGGQCYCPQRPGKLDHRKSTLPDDAEGDSGDDTWVRGKEAAAGGDGDRRAGGEEGQRTAAVAASASASHGGDKSVGTWIPAADYDGDNDDWILAAVAVAAAVGQ